MIFDILQSRETSTYVQARVRVVELTPILQASIHNYKNGQIHSTSKFWRFQLQQVLYYSREYRRVKSRNSYTVCYLVDGHVKYGQIRLVDDYPFARLLYRCVSTYAPSVVAKRVYQH